MSVIAVLQRVTSCSDPLIGMLWSCTLINRPSLAASRRSEVVPRCPSTHVRRWSRKTGRSSFTTYSLKGYPVNTSRSTPSKLAAGYVDFLDVTILVQRDVAQRGEIVEIHVAIAVGFQALLGLLQFLVLRLQLPLLCAKCLLHLLAIDGVMDCPGDGRGVGMTFDQIILCAAAYCLSCYSLIGHAGEYHDRQARGSGRKPRGWSPVLASRAATGRARSRQSFVR